MQQRLPAAQSLAYLLSGPLPNRCWEHGSKRTGRPAEGEGEGWLPGWTGSRRPEEALWARHGVRRCDSHVQELSAEGARPAGGRDALGRARPQEGTRWVTAGNPCQGHLSDPRCHRQLGHWQLSCVWSGGLPSKEELDGVCSAGTGSRVCRRVP